MNKQEILNCKNNPSVENIRKLVENGEIKWLTYNGFKTWLKDNGYTPWMHKMKFKQWITRNPARYRNYKNKRA